VNSSIHRASKHNKLALKQESRGGAGWGNGDTLSLLQSKSSATLRQKKDTIEIYDVCGGYTTLHDPYDVYNAR